MSAAPVPTAWSARQPRRRRTPLGLPGQDVVASVARVPALPASAHEGGQVAEAGRAALPALLATDVQPTPAGGGRAERAVALLPPSAKAHVAAVVEPAAGGAGASPTRVTAALARLMAANTLVFGAAGGMGAGAVAGYDARTEAAVRTTLAAAVAEAIEDGGADGPGAASVAVIVHGQGVYGATCVPRLASDEGGSSGAGRAAAEPLPGACPLIAAFDLAGALVAALPPRCAPRHAVPCAAGAATLVTQSGHAALPEDKASAICVVSPGGGGGNGGGSGDGGPPNTSSSGLRPADVAAHLGRRLWGLVTPDVAGVAEAGREALPMAWACSVGTATAGSPALSAAMLLHCAANAITGEEEGPIGAGGMDWEDGGEEDEEDPFADEFPDIGLCTRRVQRPGTRRK